MIQEAIHRIARDFGEDRFTSGDCHHLAAGLLSHFGHGKLVACIRSQVQEDGHTFCKTYSHMVYQDGDGLIWDIEGEGADLRWESQWDVDAYDEDGLRSEFTWVEVPQGSLPERLCSWQVNYDGAIAIQIKEAALRATSVDVYATPVRQAA